MDICITFVNEAAKKLAEKTIITEKGEVCLDGDIYESPSGVGEDYVWISGNNGAFGSCVQFLEKLIAVPYEYLDDPDDVDYYNGAIFEVETYDSPLFQTVFRVEDGNSDCITEVNFYEDGERYGFVLVGADGNTHEVCIGKIYALVNGEDHSGWFLLKFDDTDPMINDIDLAKDPSLAEVLSSVFHGLEVDDVLDIDDDGNYEFDGNECEFDCSDCDFECSGRHEETFGFEDMLKSGRLWDKMDEAKDKKAVKKIVEDTLGSGTYTKNFLAKILKMWESRKDRGSDN